LAKLDFALVGAAGYIASRHMQAIKAVGGNLKAAFDPNNSRHNVEGYFPQASTFVEFEPFGGHLTELERRGKGIDYVSICSPSHLHDVHCAYALRADANAICEKPVVLHPSILNTLEGIESETGRHIFAIQQLRLHPVIEALKSEIAASHKGAFSVDITYVTAREPWYYATWKGDPAKSGGIVMNIGVHFLDALVHIFGLPSLNIVHLRAEQRAAGFLVCGRAAVRWFLSVDGRDLPQAANGASTYRSLSLDDEEIDLSNGMADLHTRSYQEIVAGRGFDLRSVRPAIEIASTFNTAPIELHRGERHPFVQRHLDSGPLRLTQGLTAVASARPEFDPSSM
jgi:UDP-N-acetyl-2-amino-2-deoxyglucuronate dehydrogenase